MSAVAIIIKYFRVAINILVETSRTIINQGLDDFDSLIEFTKEDMKTLCTTISCPGRMIINPRENIANQPPNISDPGHLISMVAEKWLIMTAYTEMH